MNASVSCFSLAKALTLKLIDERTLASSGPLFQGGWDRFHDCVKAQKSTTRMTLVGRPSVRGSLLLGRHECFSLAAACFSVVRKPNGHCGWGRSKNLPGLTGLPVHASGAGARARGNGLLANRRQRYSAAQHARSAVAILPGRNRYAVFQATRFSAAPAGRSTVDGSPARSLA